MDVRAAGAHTATMRCLMRKTPHHPARPAAARLPACSTAQGGTTDDTGCAVEVVVWGGNGMHLDPLHRIGLHQLGPDVLPVVGAKRDSGHGTPRRSLDRHALLNRHAPGFPVPHGSYRHFQQIGKHRPATDQPAGRVNRMLRIRRFDEFHTNTLTRFVIFNQHHVVSQTVFNQSL